MTVDISYIASLLLGFIILVLFATSYMYLDKLEKTGCLCAEHPYKKYMKVYSVFAFVYILVMMFIPKSFMNEKSNVIMLAVTAVLSVAFLVGTVVFFVYSIKYVNYLVREKCKCSEDVRREVLYYWSIMHLIYLSIIVLFAIFKIITTAAITVAMLTTKEMNSKNTFDAVSNPFKGMKNVPSKLRSNLKSLTKMSKK